MIYIQVTSPYFPGFADKCFSARISKEDMEEILFHVCISILENGNIEAATAAAFDNSIPLQDQLDLVHYEGGVVILSSMGDLCRDLILRLKPFSPGWEISAVGVDPYGHLFILGLSEKVSHTPNGLG